jgi:hypothetical protein
MRTLALLIGFVLATLVFSQGQKPAQSKPNQPPSIEAFVSDVSVISWCQLAGVSPCSFSDGIAKLSVRAHDPNGDPLKYECTTSAGTISKCDASMSWDLKQQPNGIYTATVKVTDSRGGEDSAELQVTIADCAACDKPKPPCPTVTVSSPSNTHDIKHLVFKVATENGDSSVTPSYNWTASHGKIIKGEHTSEVVIDATGFEGEELTVKVEVGGFDPSCSTAQSQRLLIKQN